MPVNLVRQKLVLKEACWCENAVAWDFTLNEHLLRPCRVRLTGDCDRLAGQVGAMQEEKQNWLADLRQLGEEKHAWEQEKHQLLKAAQAQRQASDGDAQALSSASYGEAGENGHAENVAGGASESPVSSDLRDRHEAESLRDEQAALVEEKTRLATMNAELAERVAVLQKEQEQGTRQADGLKRELEKQKEIHERQLEAYRADHDALSQKVQALRVDAEAHTDQIGVLQRVRDTLERDVQALTAERDALMQKACGEVGWLLCISGIGVYSCRTLL